jgi:hypothetical protein
MAVYMNKHFLFYMIMGGKEIRYSFCKDVFFNMPSPGGSAAGTVPSLCPL